MQFIGQVHIINQLKVILPDLFKRRNKGCNILIRGPSGYGKTTLAVTCARYLAGHSFEVYYADSKPFNFRKRVVFIDEVHKMKDFEQLYRDMDDALAPEGVAENPHVFIFATNADGNLPEAFSNRCYEFIMEDYSTDELLLIAINASSFKTTQESYMEIVEAGSRNPRIIKSLAERMSIFFSENPTVNAQKADFKQILAEVFNIKDGLDSLARKYLDVLDDVGGTASLSLMKSLLHVDESTLKNSVEPALLQKGKIRITSKGRKLLYDNL